MTSIFTNLFGKSNPVTPLDEKKQENENGGNKQLDWKQFTIKFFTHFLVTICLGTVIIGACGLYITKVAYSDILPDDVKLAPYTETDYDMRLREGENIKDSFVVMNVLKERLWKGFNFFKAPINITSQQASFIKEDFKDNTILNYLNCIKYHTEDQLGARWSFYMRKIFFECLAGSFYAVNKIYSALYWFPEWLVLLAYFTILPFISCGVIIWTILKGLFNIISNLGIANRVYNEDGSTTQEKDSDFKWWRKIKESDEAFLDSYKWSYYLIWPLWKLTFILMPLLYAVSGLYFLGIITFITTSFAFINPLMRKYTLKGENGEQHGLGDFIRDTFFYKKTFIIFLATYNLLMSTGLYLNSSYTASCFVGILILALYFEMFQTKIPDDPTQLGGSETIGKYFDFKKAKNGDFVCLDTDSGSSLNKKPKNLRGKVTESVTNPVTESVTNPVTEPVTESVTNPVTEPVTESVTNPVTEQVIESVTEPVIESGNKTVTEQVDTTNLPPPPPIQQVKQVDTTNLPPPPPIPQVKQEGGFKHNSKVRTKTGKIRSKYNVNLI
jgi:hypothetical protein